MYYCEDCDSYFEEAEMIPYTDADIWHQGYKHICPICKSEEIEEAAKCITCGEYICKEKCEGGICDNCKADLQRAATAFIEKYKPEEQEHIIEFLNNKEV